MDGRDDLPGRTKRQCQQKRAAVLRRKKSRREWHPDEIAELLAGRREFDGRTEIAVQRKHEQECAKLRRQGKLAPTFKPGAKNHYRPDEIEAIREGRPVEGRSENAIQRKLLKLDPSRNLRPKPRWTAEQTQMLLQDPRQEIPGRSFFGRRQRLRSLGLTFGPRLSVPRGSRSSLVLPTGSVLLTASDRAVGFDLLQAISRFLPSNLPDQIKAETIGEAAILHLEEGLRPEDAAKEALRRARAFNNIGLRFGEYNGAVHDRALWD